MSVVVEEPVVRTSSEEVLEPVGRVGGVRSLGPDELGVAGLLDLGHAGTELHLERLSP